MLLEYPIMEHRSVALSLSRFILILFEIRLILKQKDCFKKIKLKTNKKQSKFPTKNNKSK